MERTSFQHDVRLRTAVSCYGQAVSRSSRTATVRKRSWVSRSCSLGMWSAGFGSVGPCPRVRLLTAAVQFSRIPPCFPYFVAHPCPAQASACDGEYDTFAFDGQRLSRLSAPREKRLRDRRRLGHRPAHGGALR